MGWWDRPWLKRVSGGLRMEQRLEGGAAAVTRGPVRRVLAQILGVAHVCCCRDAVRAPVKSLFAANPALVRGEYWAASFRHSARLPTLLQELFIKACVVGERLSVWAALDHRGQLSSGYKLRIC